MSQRQVPPESEAAATLELLTLREEISDLDLSEGRLKLQVMQLQSQIASYAASPLRAEGARDTSSPLLAADAQERLAALEAQLAEAQEQLALLATQRAALTQRQQTAQKRLNALRASLQSSSTWQGGATPWEKVRISSHRPSRKTLVVLLCTVLLIVLVGSIIRVAHLSALGLSLLSPQGPSGQTGPSEEPPFFTPAKTAPTNQGCVTTIKTFCYSPEYIQQAFGFTDLYKGGFDGSGQTIVLIGAGNTTTLADDLHTFDVAWGLPDPTLTVLYPDGPPAPYVCPAGDSLQQENTIDVEWTHAIAPGANIVLIIGANNVSASQPQANCALTSLQHDIAYALDNHLGNIISTSYGSSELGAASDTGVQKADRQKYFAAGHQLLQRAAAEHVTVLAASGDSGATNLSGSPDSDTYWLNQNVSWPASDPDTLAVGGTLLTLGNATDDDAYVGETAWDTQEAGATGGGLSAIFAEPDYQQMVPDQTIFQGKRGVPDVAFPAANLLIYSSAQVGVLIKANPDEWAHWDLADGTGVSASCWAGLIAIANQMRNQPLGLIQPALYSLGGYGMHDITTGDNTYANVPGVKAGKGYDLVTGWGTPVAKNFLAALLQAADANTSG